MKNLEKLERIRKGFAINSMTMKDSDTKEVLWETGQWEMNEERVENLPKRLLECPMVVREINFSSEEKITDLVLIQDFYLFDELVESHKFEFGFVIPNSTNNWEQIIVANQDEILSPDVLSMNLKVETIFMMKEFVIAKNTVIINYV